MKQKLLRLIAIGVFATVCSAASADPVHIMFERDIDVAAGNEVALSTYDSIADIITNTSTGTSFSTVNVSAGWSTTGATWDGSFYQILLERDTDVIGGMGEVALVTLDAIGSLISFNPISTVFSAINVSAGWSTTGLTWDGSLFHLMFERDSNQSGGFNELAFQSYNSIADIVAFNPISTSFSSTDISAGWSTAGFTYESDSDLWHVMFERDIDVPGGIAEIAIASFDSLDDIVTYSANDTSFSSINVSAGWSTSALFSDHRQAGSVPEPGIVALLGFGLLGLGWRKLRK